MANTSVLTLQDKLFAICEAGEPFALNPSTLDPIGWDNLGGAVGEGMSFSAHPKVDFETEEVYNIGLKLPKKMVAYRIDKNGKPLAIQEVEIPWTGFIHDNFLAGKYFVTMLFPMQVNPWKLVLGKSLQDSMEWKPENGSLIYIFNRNDLSLACKPINTDPFFIFHFTNGFENKDGQIEVEFVKYKDYPSIGAWVESIPSLRSQSKIEY